MTFHDMHCHLDFMSNGEAVAAEAHRAGALMFAATVTPEGFEAARERFSPYANVCVGLGLHPWWVKAEPEAWGAVERLIEALDETPFVGEIGLDLGKRHAEHREAQMAAFERIARACAERGGKLLSVHSVHAARETLDVLAQSGALESCTCIFHWFTGPSDQLKRAVAAGCYFSVGPRMLATGKGREYVKAIPPGRLLLETDAPANRGDACSHAGLQAELRHAAEGISKIKGAGVCAAIDRTSRMLLEQPAGDGRFSA